MSDADTTFRIAELLFSGLKCSHILMKLALEAQGRDDPDLVRVMSGLALGMGQGFNCGALSAGCCVLGLYAGRGSEVEAEDPRFAAALDAFSGWFHASAKQRFGGIDCADIMKFDPALKAERCPALIVEVWDKLKEVLTEQGIDPTAARERSP
ncbi:MAG: C-GCAxxG-C-C family protein [Hyphomicrobiales bacterium]|nr:C-GCAxxG-C-C family protein [Hyphomicrobiales bacterium]